MKTNLLTAVAFLFVSAVVTANPLPPPLYLEPIPPEKQNISKQCLFHFSRTMAPPLSDQKKEAFVYRAREMGNVLGDFVKIAITEGNYLSPNDLFCGDLISGLSYNGSVLFSPAFAFHDDCVTLGTYLYIVDYDCTAYATPGFTNDCRNYTKVVVGASTAECSDPHETMTMTEEEFLALKTETGYSEFCPGPEDDYLTLDFSGIVVGAEERKIVVITNRSASSYGVFRFWWEDQGGENIESGEPFLIDTETGENPCIDEVTELMPGESCNLNIVFAPTVQGSFNRRIMFRCLDQIKLLGTGVVPGEGTDDDMLSDDDTHLTDKSKSDGCSFLIME